MFDVKLTQSVGSFGLADHAKTHMLQTKFKDCDVRYDRRMYVLHTSPREVIDKIAEFLNATRVVEPAYGYAIIESEDVVAVTDSDGGRGESGARRVEFFGAPAAVRRLAEWLDTQYEERTLVNVRWWFIHKGEPTARSIVLPPAPKMVDELYPWFDEGVDQFIDDYLKSTASLLFFFGPPGTGKTSFIRYLIHKSRMDCDIAYEEGIFKSDQLFIEFMSRKSPSCLVFEDAEAILSSRDHSANPMMSRFLNISDGLIKATNKKIIFTTNLDNQGKVDQALLREGRAFATVNFRALNVAEQINLAKVLPTVVKQSAAPLSALFNGDSNAPVRQIGFAR